MTQVTHLLYASSFLPGKWAQWHCPYQELLRNVRKTRRGWTGHWHLIDAVTAGWPDPAAWMLTAALSRENFAACLYSETNICKCIQACNLFITEAAEGFSTIAEFRHPSGKGISRYQCAAGDGEGSAPSPPPLFYWCGEQSGGTVSIIDTGYCK